MKTWNFEGYVVCEENHNAELHCLACYKNDGEYLGTIYPDSVEDMNACFEAMDEGYDPIAEGWEDGLGHICTMDGWA